MGVRSVSGRYSKMGVAMLIITQKRGGGVRIVSGGYSKVGVAMLNITQKMGWMGFAVFLGIIQKGGGSQCF